MQNVASVEAASLLVGGGTRRCHAFSVPLRRRRAPTISPVKAPDVPGQPDVPEPADAPDAPNTSVLDR